MRALLLDDARAADWDGLVAGAPAFALTQSATWATFKERLGWHVRRVGMEDDDGRLVAGAQVLVKPLPLGLSMAYVPRGPIGEWLHGEAGPLLLAELERVARAERAIFLKLEPPVPAGPQLFALLSRRGYHSSRVTNQPRTTLLLDISGTEDALLARMHKKTRQYVRRAQREGISVRRGTAADLPAFAELMRLTARREGFAARSLEYYEAEWECLSADDRSALLLAEHDGRLVAVRSVHACGRHAAEFHGGSVTTPGLHPNHLLVWEAIRWARERGCETYDLWGVPDEVEPGAGGEAPATPERRDGLWGVYRFKRGFGGGVVRYAGAYDLPLRRRLHRLTSAALVNREVWERAAARLDRAAPSAITEGVTA